MIDRLLCIVRGHLPNYVGRHTTRCARCRRRIYWRDAYWSVHPPETWHA